MSFVQKLLPAAAAILAFTATPAYADAITFDSTDIGTAYTLNYNGFADTTNISGLTSSTTFTLTGISGSTYTFNYSVSNTSSSPITGSRVSGFAFNSDPNISSATSTGAFSYTTLNGNYPNGIGNVEVCFLDKSGSCAGGGSGGVNMGATGAGTFTLTFSQPVSSLTLSDFYVRYQSITGAGSTTSASGTGSLSSTSSSSGGTPVPEPGMLGLLGGALIATALLRRRRRETELKPAFA